MLTLPPEVTTVTVIKPDGTTLRLNTDNGLVTFRDTTQLGIYTMEANTYSERFAVNLFDADESAITPKNALPLHSTVEAEPNHEALKGRQEWWQWAVWLALVLLATEWLYAHRGEVARWRRVLAIKDR
jgi:hypothetical protein